MSANDQAAAPCGSDSSPKQAKYGACGDGQYKNRYPEQHRANHGEQNQCGKDSDHQDEQSQADWPNPADIEFAKSLRSKLNRPAATRAAASPAHDLSGPEG